MSAAPFDTAQGEPSVAEQAHGWVVRLAGGAAQPQDIAALRHWLEADPRHRVAFDEARTTWQMTEALAEHFAHGGDRADVLPFDRAPRRRRVIAGLSAVAALAALAAGLMLLAVFADDLILRATADFRTAVGATRALVLADGSRVTLNTDSAIAVDFAPDVRRVTLLRGEALFEVEADKTRPFRVAALGGATQAVGTAFTVRKDAGQVSVAVSEGTVQLTSPAGTAEGIFLTAGKRGGYAEGGSPAGTGTFAAQSIAPWRSGRIVLEGVPFDAAVEELDRYFPGMIVTLTGGGHGRPVSAVLSLDSLDGAIAALAETQGLSVVHITDYLVILR